MLDLEDYKITIQDALIVINDSDFTSLGEIKNDCKCIAFELILNNMINEITLRMIDQN